ncbi:hypothetical protein [Agrococcus baldri]|uniref:Lipoprotein n=1 Tax=Agrococcus baldri TaxID=153730 RepID=A0AA87URN6_9MICO|nr:hypothetical protein [Agrococcus baldri]GEK79650.1 hypothetical protein ABA31_10010 [Agrococcus baldri]
MQARVALPLVAALLLAGCAATPAAPAAPGSSSAAFEPCEVSYTAGFVSTEYMTGSGYGSESGPPEPTEVPAPSADFEPAAALEGLDVACALTFTPLWHSPLDASAISVAVVEASTDVDAAVEAFALGAGYELIRADSSAGGGPWYSWELWREPGDPESGIAATLVAHEIGADGPPGVDEALLMEASGAELGDWMLTHFDRR